MTTDHPSRPTDHRQWTTDHGLRTADGGRWTVDGGRRTTGCGLRPPSPATRHSPPATRLSSAFSLVEILVAVALLSVIILGLFAMFYQTQRAFTSSMTQTDVLEAARAVTEMVGRELEQLTPSGQNAVNYFAQVVAATPLIQNLPGSTFARTYYLEDVFILTRQNQTWTGIGYCVRTNDVNGRLWPAELTAGQAGIGSLYRYTMSTNVLQNTVPNNGLPADPNVLFKAFRIACLPGSSAISNRICDGVVHFQVRASATNGFPIVSDGVTTNAFFRGGTTNLVYSVFRPASVSPKAAYPDKIEICYSWSNAVPAYLEFEFGILESRALARYNSITDPTARRNYFQREDLSTRVHLFRQRTAVRNADPSAFQ